MRQVIFSRRAENRLLQLLEYLQEEWSENVKSNFLLKLDKALSKVKAYPESCPESREIKGLRKLVITKQTSLFYNYDEKSIYVFSLIDNRMDVKNR